MGAALVVLLAILGLLVVAGLVVVQQTRRTEELLKEAGALKTVADGLQQQLQQFKEGGFDRLINDKLEVLRSQTEQSRQELLDQQTRATNAALGFQKNLGEIVTKLAGLSQLQASVGELNNLLKPQQLRGELGEVIVRGLITDKLPRDCYEEEHAFRDGKKVEFAIRIGDRLVSVDSKLQLEAFKRSKDAALDDRERQASRTEFKRTVRMKIDEVAAYIRPEEGTHNFAIMVIPSEAVYYEVITGKEFAEERGLVEHAWEQRVFLASPSTFWAYLCSIAQGLRGLEVERRAAEILTRLQALTGDVRTFAGEEFRLLGIHLRHAASQYEGAEKRLRAIQEGLGALERGETNALVEKELTA